MNVTSRAGLFRKALTSLAVAAVAATCLVSGGSSVSASGTHRSDVTSVTKEWKAYTSTALKAPATKEW